MLTKHRIGAWTRCVPRVNRPVAGAMALLALAVGGALAWGHDPSALRSSAGPIVSGTIIAASTHQLVVATKRGERVVLKLESRTVALRDGPAFTTALRTQLPSAIVAGLPGAATAAREPTLDSRVSSVPWIFAILGLLAVGAAGVVAMGSPMSAVSTSMTGHMIHVLKERNTAMRTPVHHPRVTSKGSRSRASIVAVPLLALLVAGVQPSGAAEKMVAPAAAPSTTAHYFSSHPMISGTVVTVNDHQLVVDTDQGERITLEMDSRTMAPRDLAPGMTTRTEFLALEDCRFYAQRVMPVRSGMSTDRLQAYANTRDGHAPATPHAYASEGNGGKAGERHTGHPASAGEPAPGMLMKATPTTADHNDSSRPMMSGRVVSANDHRLVVQTDQGRMVGMVMDSRTMVPREIAPGTVIRSEFTQLEDGRYYAKRVSITRSAVADREQAYAHTRDSDVSMAGIVGDCASVSPTPAHTVTAAVAPSAAAPAPVVAQNPSEPAPAPESPKLLPQTSSPRPLLLLIGLLALGTAGLSTVVRGRRTT